MVPLGAGLWVFARIFSDFGGDSRVTTLLMRMAAGLAISLFTLAMIYVLLRFDHKRPLREVGLGHTRAGGCLAWWGLTLWAVPACLAMTALSMLGASLRLSVPPAELLLTIFLLFLAVLLVEAIPEEAVFRGYLMTILMSSMPAWFAVTFQALIFTLFGGILRQDWNLVDLSLFLTMGIGFGYLRLITGSVWMSVGFHAAFQTGAQLVLSHDVLEFAGDPTTAMLALGAIPFTIAGIIVTTRPLPQFITRRL